MRLRLLVNLGLLAVFIALAWFAFKLDAPPPAAPGVALTSLSAPQISTITIERDGNTVAKLQRIEGVWQVQTPIRANADAFRVQSLLTLPSARSTTGFRAAGNDLTQFGLQPPRASVRFDDTLVLIGDTDPVAGDRYVLSDDQVHLLEDKWFSHIFGEASAWLDPRPLPAAARPLRIELRTGASDASPHSVSWQQVDGRWQRVPADPGSPSGATSIAMEQRGTALAAAWRQARALSVQRRDPALEWKGQVVITFSTAQESDVTQVVDTGTEQDSSLDAARAGDETLKFSVALSDDAMVVARDDLGVQYRFLARQGKALLDTLLAQ